MKKTALGLLLALPLSAQSFEVGAFLGQQLNKDVAVVGTKIEVDSTTVVGFRFGYSFVDFGPILLQGTLGYQGESKGKVKLDGVEEPGARMKHDHTAIGVMANFKAVVAVGAGIEYRMEKLRAVDPSESRSVTYNRPWLRANLGYALPTPLLKPFIGLEVAMPLSSTSVSLGSSEDDLLKGLAPKFQIGLYGGIRF